jgi:hypothetical protein
LKRARSLYTEKAAIRKELLSERRVPVWPINLAPDPGVRFAPASGSPRRIGGADRIHAHPENLQ